MSAGGAGVRRAAMLLLLLVAGLLQTGCWGVASMEKTGLVTLLGIDLAPHHELRVTVAVISPIGVTTAAGTGGGGGGSSNPPELVRSATAASTLQAIQQLSAETYLNLDFTHIKGVVVSVPLAEAGLAGPLEFLTEAIRFEATPWLYVARGETASQLLQASQQAVPDAGEVLNGTATWGQYYFPAYADRVFTFTDQMLTAGDQPATVGITLTRSPQGKGQTMGFALTGMALFRGDRLVGWLDAAQSLGWLLASGRSRSPSLDVRGPGGALVSLQILGVRRRVLVRAAPGGPRLDLRLHVALAVRGVAGAPLNFWARPADLDRVATEAARRLAADVQAALRVAQAAGSDVFGLGERVRLQDPGYWRAVRNRWDTGPFRQLPVAVQVQVRVRQLGKAFAAALPAR